MSSKAQRRGSDYRRKRKRFHANQYTRNVSNCISASAKKLCKENYLDKESTDEEPMHHFCPIGDTSWCKYQKAVATNSVSLFKHKNIVPIAVMDEIKPIIAELSAPKLLKKCVG
ncbi:uncharacterized protein TNCV_869861 [Trichonephila clavipes]|nr:uncharacterized protein TNCV_869861 [Trichonephila clavipes]